MLRSLCDIAVGKYCSGQDAVFTTLSRVSVRVPLGGEDLVEISRTQFSQYVLQLALARIESHLTAITEIRSSSGTDVMALEVNVDQSLEGFVLHVMRLNVLTQLSHTSHTLLWSKLHLLAAMLTPEKCDFLFFDLLPRIVELWMQQSQVGDNLCPLGVASLTVLKAVVEGCSACLSSKSLASPSVPAKSLTFLSQIWTSCIFPLLKAPWSIACGPNRCSSSDEEPQTSIIALIASYGAAIHEASTFALSNPGRLPISLTDSSSPLCSLVAACFPLDNRASLRSGKSLSTMSPFPAPTVSATVAHIMIRCVVSSLTNVGAPDKAFLLNEVLQAVSNANTRTEEAVILSQCIAEAASTLDSSGRRTILFTLLRSVASTPNLSLLLYVFMSVTHSWNGFNLASLPLATMESLSSTELIRLACASVLPQLRLLYSSPIHYGAVWDQLQSMTKKANSSSSTLHSNKSKSSATTVADTVSTALHRQRSTFASTVLAGMAFPESDS